MAASVAVFELEVLKGQDKPRPWMRPGYGDYARFVRWLNKNLAKLASKKKVQPYLRRLLTDSGAQSPKLNSAKALSWKFGRLTTKSNRENTRLVVLR
jgi:hypothetical protein